MPSVHAENSLLVPRLRHGMLVLRKPSTYVVQSLRPRPWHVPCAVAPVAAPCTHRPLATAAAARPPKNGNYSEITCIGVRLRSNRYVYSVQRPLYKHRVRHIEESRCRREASNRRLSSVRRLEARGTPVFTCVVITRSRLGFETPYDDESCTAVSSCSLCFI